MIDTPRPSRVEFHFATALFAVLVVAHVVLVFAGWSDQRMPGNEFREVQTAIAALFAQREGCRIDYPMPLLGSPWSAPMEFPFYQWSVARYGQLTGTPIVQSGRAISLLCFYAALPALWLLLRRAGLPGWQRRIGLGLVLATPVYIFYSRGVTIEPMALLFSLWFLAALVEAIARDSMPWLFAASLAGIGAGLEKITTWMLYLIPVGVWLLMTAVRARREREAWTGLRWRKITAVCGALLVPCIVAVGWVRFSDALKADHPSSAFLVSSGMTSHNFGTLAVRLSAHFWSDLLHMWTLSAAWPALWVLLVVASGWAGRWRGLALACLGLFFAAPMIFPILYSWHDYYFYANAVLLAGGACFVFAGLRERWSSPAPAWLFLVICLGLQYSAYFKFQYPDQKSPSPGGSGLTFAIRDLTETDDILVIAGQDWHGFIPFYSQRRALMIRRNEEQRWELIKTSFDHLRDDFVALLVLVGEQRENRELLRLAVERLGIDPRPFASYRDSVVYANRAVRWDYLSRLHSGSYPGVTPLEGIVLPEKPSTGTIRRHQMNVLFGGMSPKPHRYQVPYSIACYPADDGSRAFTAHSTSALWFRVPPGRRSARVEFGLLASSYNGQHDPTDGVTLEIVEQTATGTERILHQHTIDPAKRNEDRGVQTDEAALNIATGSEVIVRITPGPHHNGAFDWGFIKSVRIE